MYDVFVFIFFSEDALHDAFLLSVEFLLDILQTGFPPRLLINLLLVFIRFKFLLTATIVSRIILLRVEN